MIRGKAMMIDPTKLMPGMGPPRALIKPKPAEPAPAEPEEAAADEAPATESAAKDGKIQHLNTGRAKIAGRRTRAPQALKKVWDNPNKGRENVVKEVSMGEMMYAGLLTMYAQKFATPLAAQPGKAGLTKEQATILTRHLLEMEKFHMTFAAEMQKSQQVPGTILAHKDRLIDMYRRYVDEYFSILQTVHGLRGNATWINWVRNLPRDSALEDVLLAPLQRMPVYELLLRKLAASTSADHEEAKALAEAITVVKAISIYTDQKSGNAEQATAVLGLQHKLQGRPANFELYSPTRRVIRKGPLGKARTTDPSSRQERFVFLCNDLLLWTTTEPKTGNYIYRGHIGLETLRPQEGGSQIEFKVAMLSEVPPPKPLPAVEEKKEEKKAPVVAPVGSLAAQMASDEYQAQQKAAAEALVSPTNASASANADSQQQGQGQGEGEQPTAVAPEAPAQAPEAASPAAAAALSPEEEERRRRDEEAKKASAALAQAMMGGLKGMLKPGGLRPAKSASSSPATPAAGASTPTSQQQQQPPPEPESVKKVKEGMRCNRYDYEPGSEETKILIYDNFLFFSQSDPEAAPLGAFYWCEPGTREASAAQRLKIADISVIRPGKQHPIFAPLPHNPEDAKCFTLEGQSGVSLHLEAPDEATAKAWIDAVQHLQSPPAALPAAAAADASAAAAAEEEAKRKAAEEEAARKKAAAEAAEAVRRSEEEARKRAEEAAKKRAEEEARRKAEVAAKRAAEAEALRKQEEEEAAARAKEEAEAKRQADEEEAIQKRLQVRPWIILFCSSPLERELWSKDMEGAVDQTVRDYWQRRRAQGTDTEGVVLQLNELDQPAGGCCIVM